MRPPADEAMFATRTGVRVRGALAMLLSLSASACQRAETRLELTVRADGALNLDKVDVTIAGAGRKMLTRRFPVQPAGSAATAPDITWEVTVPDLSTPLVLTIEVRGGTASEDNVVSLTAEANLSPKLSVDALLRLTSSCRRLVIDCSSATDKTCVDGSCQPHPVFGSKGDSGIPVTVPDGATDTGTPDRPQTPDARDARDTGAADRGDGAAGAVNGTVCGKPTDCASGNCVESVCCDKPCDDVCTSCKIALTVSSPNGTCAPVASGLDDPKGMCGTTPAMPSTCGNTSRCDGNGACEKYGGTTVCATATCNANGSFTPASTCDGKGVCPAATAQDCKGFACSTTGGCATTCAVDPDCPLGYCSATKTCAAKKIDGSACVGNNECQNAHCVGGICCQSACDTTCVSCANAETNAANGLCRPIVAGGSSKGKCVADTTACGRDGTCDGNSGCRNRSSTTTCGSPVCDTGQLRTQPFCDGAGMCGAAPAAKPCPGGVVCASATACKSPTCAADADCVSTSYCLNMVCTPKVGNGGQCDGNNQCASNSCIANICCENSCTGTCMACAMADTGAADGLCRAIKAGGASKGKCAVSATAPCGNDGSCDGSGMCAVARATTNCGSPLCTNATLRDAPTCNGAGMCITPTTTRPCPGGVACGSTIACGATSCARDTDCAAGNYCSIVNSVGTCTPTKSDGTACTLGTECTHANCVGGLCCENACTGTCTSCANADTGVANGLCRSIRSGGSSKGKCPPGPMPCGQDGTCDGNGSCHFPPVTTPCADPVCSGSQLKRGATCTGTGACGTATTAACPGGVVCSTATTCKPPTCVADTDCVSNFCDNGVCSAKRANGQGCLLPRECNSGFCADGVCCNMACTGSCQFCNVSTQTAGTCNVISGAPRTGHPACTGTAPCNGSCNGTATGCTFPTTSCRDASCPTTTTSIRPANCDGQGSCPGVTMATCNPYICSANACLTSCTTNAQCAGGACIVSGGVGTCRACTAGQTVCPNLCANLTSDGSNCGACGHSCLGGACVNSVCQPFPIVTGLTGVPGPLQIDGTNIFWTEGDTSQIMLLNTATLARRVLNPSGLRLAYRPDGDIFLSKFGSSFTTFNTCTLSATCPTSVALSDANTTGGDFQIDKATQRLFYTDFSFPDSVQTAPMTPPWRPAGFMTLPVGNMTAGIITLTGGFLYGTALPVTATGTGIFWRSSTTPATNTAAILSTQIPIGGPALPQVGVTSNRIFFFTSTNVILSFPLNGSGSAPPTTYFNPGAFGGFAVDETFVYWTDFAIGTVSRCPVAGCTAAQVEIIASGQPSAVSLVQDARALYWGQAQQVGMHQLMRWAK